MTRPHSFRDRAQAIPSVETPPFGRASAMEALEPRTLFAAVHWDGGGGDGLWHSPLNWSTDSVPTETDDVVIDVAANPTIAFTSETGSRKVNSLVSAERINFTGGSLAVTGSAHLFAPATLDGAELSGGTWGFSHGLVVSGSFSNRLSWIAIHSGDVLLHTPSAYLRLCGSVGLGAGAIRLSGNNAYIGIEDTVTLSSGTIAFEGQSAHRTGIEGVSRGSTLTISIGATLRGGNADIGGSRFHGKPFSLTNQGVISADINGQSLSLGNGHLANFHNKGTVRATNGGTLRVESTVLANYSGDTRTLSGGAWWSDNGSLVMTGARIRTIAPATTVGLSGTRGSFASIDSLSTNRGLLIVNNGRALTTSQGGTLANTRTGTIVSSSGTGTIDSTYVLQNDGSLSAIGDSTLQVNAHAARAGTITPVGNGTVAIGSSERHTVRSVAEAAAAAAARAARGPGNPGQAIPTDTLGSVALPSNTLDAIGSGSRQQSQSWGLGGDWFHDLLNPQRESRISDQSAVAQSSGWSDHEWVCPPVVAGPCVSGGLWAGGVWSGSGWAFWLSLGGGSAWCWW